MQCPKKFGLGGTVFAGGAKGHNLGHCTYPENRTWKSFENWYGDRVYDALQSGHKFFLVRYDNFPAIFEKRHFFTFFCTFSVLYSKW